jgi:CRISPR-associated endonuclease Csn1
MTEQNSTSEHYILGLDIGANSIGWALLRARPDGESGRLKPVGIERIGSRIFSAGVLEERGGEFARGKEESLAAQRREKRAARRNHHRTVIRLRDLFLLIRGAGLLPSTEAPADFAELDKKLVRKWQAVRASEGATKEELELVPHVLPYLLRARALDQRLEPEEIGRALYHLGQRRGFLSNRKSPAKKKEEEGPVKEGISELEKQIEQSSARTLGEYFSKLNPHVARIRGKYTSRKMFEDEFEKIWLAQAPHYPAILTDDLKEKVCHALFFQRPLKSQKHLIGECEFEPGRKRAPLAILPAQRFRYLQKINDTLVREPHGSERSLTPEERDILLGLLENKGDLAFKKAYKELHLPEWHRFNFDAGGEDKFVGNRTAKKLLDIFGTKWADFSDVEKDQVVQDVLTIEKEDDLKRRGRDDYGLDDEAAEKFSRIELEPGYCRLSRQALAKLLPLMEQRTAYATAVKQVYGERPKPEPVLELPPLDEAVPSLRNPAVHRALTEVRKVVNSVIREYGKPEVVRIELARDLKKPRKDREAIWKKNRANEKARGAAAERMAKEAGIREPRRNDILKVLLAEECNWECPYTGRSISIGSLFGEHPQFDIEHIVPFDRCLDDSFANKTLCYAEENRNVKRGHTPSEVYGGTPKWDEIIGRVKRFKSDMARAKLERFQLQTLRSLADFAESQLNDTKYASRLATELLGTLYGAVVDDSGKRRVFASRGQVTAYLRWRWNLNTILGDPESNTKERADHRHHAIDAVAIAMTDPGTVKALSDAAQRAQAENRRLFGKLVEPWPGFLDDVRKTVDGIVVSHRVSRKVNGPLHEETNYGPGRAKDENGNPVKVRIRKRLDALTKPELDEIVDKEVGALVRIKLKELGEEDPKKAFKDPKNHPSLIAKDGRKIPIHKVRIEKAESTFRVGEGLRARWVMTKENHHVEIVEVKDKKGNPKWEGFVVNRFEAMRRLKAREAIVRRDHGEGKRFVFTLVPGDTIELDGENGVRVYYRVRSVVQLPTTVRIDFVGASDARLKKDTIAAGGFYPRTIETLRKAHCQKVVVDPLGNVRRAND